MAEGENPELPEKHLMRAVEIVHNRLFEHKIISLEAWNSRAEGNDVEPSALSGNAYPDIKRSATLANSGAATEALMMAQST
jgi:hypothetical protein